MKPSPAADAILIEHMMECLDHIDDDTQRQRTTFFASRTVRDAVLRNLHMLTESSQRLTEAVKSSEPGQPWRQISATRNILVHNYLGGIDMEAVWIIIENDLPALRAALVRMQARTTGTLKANTEAP